MFLHFSPNSHKHFSPCSADVVEVTYCNSISVAEHVVMMILALVRNYIPSYNQVISGETSIVPRNPLIFFLLSPGGWNIADCVSRAYDVEGMDVGTIAAGRIGLGVLERLHPFKCRLHYTDRHRLPKEVSQPRPLIFVRD